MVEDHWDPRELQMQQILQSRDSKRYELYSEISYADRHYIYKIKNGNIPLSVKKWRGRANNMKQKQYKPYIVLYKRVE